MKTFALVSAVVYGLWFLWFLYFMHKTKPKWYKGYRFVGNWKEGGQYVFMISMVVNLFISAIATFLILAFNFLEK